VSASVSAAASPGLAAGRAGVGAKALVATDWWDDPMNYAVPPPPLPYDRPGGALMVEVAPYCYLNKALLHLQARLGPVEHRRQSFGALPPDGGSPMVPATGRGYWAAEAWIRRQRLAVEPHCNRVTWGEPRYFEPRPEPALFVPADIETRSKWINVPGGRPLTAEEKRRDLFALISCGRSIYDPPPSLGATKPPKSRQAGAEGIRVQPPLNTRPGKLATRIVEKIDPAERAARIAHLDAHGMGASRLWKNTRKPGEFVEAPEPTAPGETEIAHPVRSTFDYHRLDDRTQRRPVIVTARRRRRPYTALSDSRTPNDRGRKFYERQGRQVAQGLAQRPAAKHCRQGASRSIVAGQRAPTMGTASGRR
jgi:hypothetical protein